MKRENPRWVACVTAAGGRESVVSSGVPMATVCVNEAELYYEIRGSGPAVLLIMGATGDAGHFEAFADLLADEFTVVSYDRRGYGRSPAPDGWQTTSPRAARAEPCRGLTRSIDKSSPSSAREATSSARPPTFRCCSYTTSA